jgi:inorganic triphosphatase YgiF
MAQRETEFKYSFSSSDYRKLREVLGQPTGERRFVNRYFTVEGGTERKDWVLRLRVEGSKRELTLKIGRELSPGMFDSVEYNQLVENADPETWQDAEPMIVLRREVSQAPIVLQGESRNHRLLFEPPVGVGRVWELDRCELPDGQEFCELEVEVEVETAEACSELEVTLVGWLSQASVSIAPSQMTKYARFLASIKN